MLTEPRGLTALRATAKTVHSGPEKGSAFSFASAYFYAGDSHQYCSLPSIGCVSSHFASVALAGVCVLKSPETSL
jgi:hypothetical protein